MKNTEVQLVEADGLSRMKWEYEIDKNKYPDLLGMGTADMDFKSPQPLLDELAEVIRTGHLGYPWVDDRYYEVISQWLKRTCGWEIEGRFCIANGLGIYHSAGFLIDLLSRPGDRVTILSPVHMCFKQLINVHERFCLECPLVLDGDHYRINYQMLESCFASGSRLLWLCNPHNPVGRVWKREELEKIAKLCLKYNVSIMSDDVYCGLLYEGYRYTPIASLSPEISRRTVTMYSTSKSYNTSGLRHSYIVTENAELLKRYREAIDRYNMNYGMNIMGIHATMAAYSFCDGWLKELMHKVAENHAFLADFCAEKLALVHLLPAEATYFAWIDMRKLGIPPKQLAYLIAQEEHLIVENGSNEGKGGDGFIRINLATSRENVEEAAERLLDFYQHHTMAC